MMDTSMDDLFSDLERSNHAISDPDVAAAVPDSASTFVLTESAFGEEFKLQIRRHDSVECALVYSVALSTVGSNSDCAAEFVCPYSPSSTPSSSNKSAVGATGPSPVSWPIVRPCVLSAVKSTHSTLGDCRPTLPVLSVRQRWVRTLQKRMELCAHPEEFSLVVWLVGFSNGMVHQFRRDTKGQLHYAHFFTLPSLNPVSTWNWVDSPICIDLPATPSRCTEDVLVAVDCYGCGVACWLPEELEMSDNTLTCFQMTEFRLPAAPSEITHVQSHGSWVHMVTNSGHICSLHLSYVKANPDEESIACNWRLVCEPANFPRVPAHMIPTRCLTDDQRLRPRWRFYNIQAFTRLSDGHLGGQLYSGEKIRLVDLLCKPETPDPRPVNFSGNDTTLIAAIASLSETHKRCRAYLDVLRIFGFLADKDKPATPSDLLVNSSQQGIFSFTVRLNVRSSECASGSPPLDLSVTVAPKEPPILQPGLLTCWDSLSSAQLMSCLFQKNHRCYVFDLKPRLTVKISCITVEYADAENEMESLPLFTYSEPWYDADMLLDPEHVSRTDWSRRLILPETWFTCLRQNYLSGKSPALRIRAFVDWEPPTLPAAFFQPGYVLNSPSLTTSYTFDYPPLSTRVGMCDLDMLHWLCPVRLLSSGLKSSIAFSNQSDTSGTNPFTMTYRIPSLPTLQAILSDACKSTIDLSSLNDGEPDPSVNTETSFRLIFFPTERMLTLSWKRLSGRECGADAHFGSNAIHLTITSTCLRTLGWLHRALDRRIRPKGFKSELPCIETLRQEYCILKALRSSLQQLKVESPIAGLNEPKMKIQSVLKAFCTVRNSFASAVFTDHG